MTSYYSFDDIECLQEKVDRAAPELFKKQPGLPPLEVSRVYKEEIGEDRTVTCYVRNQNMWDVSHVIAMKDVRQIDPNLPCCPKYRFQVSAVARKKKKQTLRNPRIEMIPHKFS